MSKMLLRVFLAISVALGVCMLPECTSGGGRPFLRSHRCYHLIDATRDPQGGWALDLRRTFTNEEGAFAEFDRPGEWGVVRLVIEEDSMGRADSAMWLAWRASHWNLFEIETDGEPAYYEDAIVRAQHLAMFDELDQFIVDELIPGSRAAAYWNDVPIGPVTQRDVGWHTWQRRTMWENITATAAVGLLLGIAVSLMLLPPRWLKNAIAHADAAA